LGAGEKKKARNLTYNDQRALDSLPAEVEAMTMQITQMEAELSDPALYAKSPGKFNDLTKEIDAVRAELEAKELRWLELEELAESLKN